MTTDNVRVRLVPKSKGGESISVNLAEITPQMAKRFAPDPDRASFALQPAFNLGIEAKITRHNSLEGDMPRAKFAEAFGISLVEEPLPSSEEASFSRSGTMLTT